MTKLCQNLIMDLEPGPVGLYFKAGSCLNAASDKIACLFQSLQFTSPFPRSIGTVQDMLETIAATKPHQRADQCPLGANDKARTERASCV